MGFFCNRNWPPLASQQALSFKPLVEHGLLKSNFVKIYIALLSKPDQDLLFYYYYPFRLIYEYKTDFGTYIFHALILLVLISAFSIDVAFNTTLLFVNDLL